MGREGVWGVGRGGVCREGRGGVCRLGRGMGGVCRVGREAASLSVWCAGAATRWWAFIEIWWYRGLALAQVLCLPGFLLHQCAMESLHSTHHLLKKSGVSLHLSL